MQLVGIKLTKRFYKFLFFSAVWIILILATVPDDGVELDVAYEDKIKHIFAFIVLSFLLNKASSTIAHRVRNMVALFLFGCFIELIQLFLPYREASVFDIYADLTGILIFQLMLSAYRFYSFSRGRFF